MERVTGGLAGNWCFRGGSSGTGRGGTLTGLRYIPVDSAKLYHLEAAFKADDAAATVYLGCACYDASKAYLSDVWVVTAATPGASWVRYQRIVGPTGHAALAANTAYIRVRAVLQYNAALVGKFAWVDDVRFVQMADQRPHVISAEFSKPLADGVATDVFSITTPSAPAGGHGGSWGLWLKVLVSDGLATSGVQASKVLTAYVHRSVRNDASAGVTGAVVEISESASVTTSAPNRDITTLTVSATEISEYQINIAVLAAHTGAQAAALNVVVFAELVWGQFPTPPVMAQL